MRVGCSGAVPLAAVVCARLCLGGCASSFARAESDGKHPIDGQSSPPSNRFFFAWQPLSMCDAVTIDGVRSNWGYRSVGRRLSVRFWMARAGCWGQGRTRKPARHRMAWISSCIIQSIDRSNGDGVWTHNRLTQLDQFIHNTQRQAQQAATSHPLSIACLGYSGYRFDAPHTAPPPHPLIRRVLGRGGLNVKRD